MKLEVDAKWLEHFAMCITARSIDGADSEYKSKTSIERRLRIMNHAVKETRNFCADLVKIEE